MMFSNKGDSFPVFCVTTEVREYILDLNEDIEARPGCKKVEMIKVLRQKFDISLKTAKEAVEYVLEDKHGD